MAGNNQYQGHVRVAVMSQQQAEAGLEHSVAIIQELLDVTGGQERREQLLQGLMLLCGALDLVKRAAPHIRRAGQE